ncbi:MAG: CGNR zinc finger domain-containing protein [Antricoccus sp.]
MTFAHDTNDALVASAALVNTLYDGLLITLDDLNLLLERHAFTGTRAHDQAELQSVRDLRPRLRAFWNGNLDANAALVNDILAEYRALPQLVRHDDVPWHIHAVAFDAPLARRMAVEAAMAMADVVRSNELQRLRICAADDCGDVLVDLSRNRSKRFCEGGCGNRTNVAAYRARSRM